jgi:peroxiredoxin Q/BCP
MLGKPVADFSLPSTGGSTISLSGARGKALVLYFYPRDNTPGCTQQGSDFRDAYAAFRRAGVHLYGISRDSLKSHLGFQAKMKRSSA